MFGFLKRRRSNQELFDQLYASLSDASRAPYFFAEMNVPDTVDGRFDMLTLHAVLVLERLRQLPSPADDFAQDFVDDLFKRFDAALREMGVGDISVPKRMKRIASHFLGRAKAYNDALNVGPEEMARALARNVFNDEMKIEDGARLNQYVNDARQVLGKLDFSAISRADIVWPNPAASAPNEASRVQS